MSTLKRRGGPLHSLPPDPEAPWQGRAPLDRPSLDSQASWHGRDAPDRSPGVEPLWKSRWQALCRYCAVYGPAAVAECERKERETAPECLGEVVAGLRQLNLQQRAVRGGWGAETPANLE